MAILYNLARMNTTTVGAGTVTLTTAVGGYLTFALAGASNGDVVDYAINDGANSEIGTGTYSSAGPTLTRTVTKSTNSNAAISLSGTAQVFITPRAETLNDASLFTTGTLLDARLSNVITAGGPQGDAAHTQVLTWDAHGRLLTVTNTAIAIASGAVSGLAAIATSGSGNDIATGTVPTARLGSGTANSTTFLRGDNTWQVVSNSGALISVVEYSSTQTITIPAGATKAGIELWGGCGGGGAGGGTFAYGGSGSGGLQKYLTGLTPGNTLAFTRGAGGVGANGSTAGAGGNSTLASGTQTITTLTASGGGAGNAPGSAQGAPGTGTNGDLNITGQYGGTAVFDPPSGNGGVGSGGAAGLGKAFGGFANFSTSASGSGDPGGCRINWYA